MGGAARVCVSAAAQLPTEYGHKRTENRPVVSGLDYTNFVLPKMSHGSGCVWVFKSTHTKPFNLE